MESQYTTLGMMGLSVLLDVTVTILIVSRLCKSKLICSFNKSSLVLFNVLILIFCTILIRLDISMGTGVGLFAVLAMFRFRSEVLKTQEMFYLLMLIGIGFVHAAFPDVLSLTEVLFIDVALVAMSFVLAYSNKVTHSFHITLDNLDLIKPENERKLKTILEQKTGFVVSKVEVLNINIKKRRARLNVVTEDNLTPRIAAREVIKEADSIKSRQLEISPVHPYPLAAN